MQIPSLYISHSYSYNTPTPELCVLTKYLNKIDRYEQKKLFLFFRENLIWLYIYITENWLSLFYHRISSIALSITRNQATQKWRRSCRNMLYVSQLHITVNPPTGRARVFEEVPRCFKTDLFDHCQRVVLGEYKNTRLFGTWKWGR